MPQGTTKLAQMINPEVMADMISANLPKAIKFANILAVDTTLEGQPGNTVTVPAYDYIGSAKDVAEGAAIDLNQLETSSKKFTIKKAGIGVKITDEAVLSGYGDPIGEAVRQLGMSIADKIEDDVIATLKTTTLEVTSANQISYEGIVNGVDKFAEESDVPKVSFTQSN